jgi:hypothetical protein
MKKHGPPPIEKQWRPVCETTRFPCPATKGRWVIVEMRTLFMGVGNNQVICHLCRQKLSVEPSFTHVLLDPTWKTAYRRAQEKEKAKEALDIVARMVAEHVIEDMEKERLGDRTTDQSHQLENRDR